LRDELRQLARLAGPIALVQVGTNALNLVDVALLGRHTPAALPAMAMGSALAWSVMMFVFGTLIAVDPLLSQAIGARDREAIPRILGRAGILAFLLALPAALLLLPAHQVLRACGQPAALLDDAASYARWQGLGVLPFLWYSVIRSFLSAHARVWPQVATIVAGNILNFALDIWLIFGGLGVPALGATGAAIATVVVRWLMFATLFWLGRDLLLPQFRRLREASVRAAVCAWPPLLRLARRGVPVGAQLLLEIGVFAAVALGMGQLDAATVPAGATGVNLAGHQIAMQLASLSFMLPLGIGIGASVRVGWAVGRQDHAAVRRSVRAALLAGGGVMGLSMAIFLLFPEQLAALLGEHAPALHVAAILIPIAGVFQIGDGLQVVAVGCLRGLGDLRAPVLANVIGFWLVGLPVGCLLAFRYDLGPAGLWWGLVFGLGLVAAILLLVLRLRVAERRPRLAMR
jgi:MATE family multidrug resistance protein